MIEIKCPSCGRKFKTDLPNSAVEFLNCPYCAAECLLKPSDTAAADSSKSEHIGFAGLFRSRKYKREIECLQAEKQEMQAEIEKLRSEMTPEMRDVERLRNQTASMLNTVHELENKISSLNIEIISKEQELSERKKSVIETDEKILLQNFGLYEPTYDFQNSAEYRAELQKIRQKQKDMIKYDTAAYADTEWTVNGSQAEGRKMVKDLKKLLLRAFNSECSELIDKVKYNTFDTALRRITSSYDNISKLGKVDHVRITQGYYNLKIDELRLAFEYRQKQQEEKERQREYRAQLKEEAKLQKEIEAERKKYEKERAHYTNAMRVLEDQISRASESEIPALLEKRREFELQLSDIQKSLQDIDYREANKRAGYVYVISNIGSFGENVYKIGMTRRLDPMERVRELGDASVPFNFDVHAMIFSDDAPALETALHRAFEGRKLNLVNTRREFFNVTLDEIKDVVRKNFDKTVEFIDLADAEQYRLSLKMKGTE